VSVTQAFNDAISDLGLIDIPLLDRLFTWSNHRATPTLARLDRVFYNNSMSLIFPNSSLTSLPKPTSDHTPILLTVSTSIPKPNLFRFENGWLKDRDFLPSILPAWHGHLHGNAAGAMAGALKAVRSASKAWARSKRAPPSLHQNYKFVIYLFDVLEETQVLSTGNSCCDLNVRRSSPPPYANVLLTRSSAASGELYGKATPTPSFSMLTPASACAGIKSAVAYSLIYFNYYYYCVDIINNILKKL